MLCTKLLEQNTYAADFLSSSVSIWQHSAACTWGLWATDIPSVLPNSCAKLRKPIFRSNKLGRASPLSKDWFADWIFLSLISDTAELHL